MIARIPAVRAASMKPTAPYNPLRSHSPNASMPSGAAVATSVRGEADPSRKEKLERAASSAKAIDNYYLFV